MRADGPVWYPFTPMLQAPEPIHVLSGSGALLHTADGRSIIDAVSSWWTNIHGHAHPYLKQRIAEQFGQLEHVMFAGFTHTPAIQLAARITELCGPDITKMFFSDNGSTAVEVALKMAIQYHRNESTGKHRIIALHKSYHGDTFGSMSVSDRDAFTAPFHDKLFDVTFIEPPLPGKELSSMQQLTAALEKGDVAAIIYEPLVMGAAGMLMYEPEALDAMIECAHHHGALCIADEVMTGFYRTGNFLASHHAQHRPDIICLSKGITGGSMPLGATVCTEAIFSAFYDADMMKALYHGHSYTANPLACAVANASLDLCLQPGFKHSLERIADRHHQFAASIRSFGSGERPVIANLRQCGTILAFDVIAREDTGYFNPIRDELYHFFIERDILLRPLGNTIYILPPYCITDTMLDTIYGAIRELLIQLTEKQASR